MKVNRFEKFILNNFIWALVQRKAIMPFWSDSISLPEDAVVLEVGCGRGAGAVILVDGFNPRKIDALDLDEDMIRKAREYIPEPYLGRINLNVGDVMGINAGDGTYDAVFDFFTMDHVGDWRKGLCEVSRVLKPGGYFAFIELYATTLENPVLRHLFAHPPESGFEREDWIRALAENGLRLMEKKNSLMGRGLMGVARKCQ